MNALDIFFSIFAFGIVGVSSFVVGRFTEKLRVLKLIEDVEEEAERTLKRVGIQEYILMLLEKL
ncbi:hypothetical protein [Enterococcus sp. DIV0800]|uniref:hypothetical protein n=1 Tax=unclassified Enterococcus TaxID=2608891 RepID=UPI003D2F9D58